MAISINWQTQVIFVPQADLTLVGGTLYELDTDAFRLALKDLEDGEEGQPFPDTHRHNTEVSVAGTTFARSIEIINGYSVEFEDGQYTVRLVGSNNNLFDVENGILAQNQVQIIAGNSAGLIVGSGGGSGPSAAQVADAVWDESLAAHVAAGSTGEALVSAALAAQPGEAMTLTPSEREAVAEALLDLAGGVEPTSSVREALRLILAAQAGKLSGATGPTVSIRDLGDTKDRIVATVDEDGNRLAVTTDAT